MSMIELVMQRYVFYMNDTHFIFFILSGVEEETAKRQIGNHHQRHGDHWQAVKQSLQERCVEDV